MLIVLDWSGSMIYGLPGDTTPNHPSRWQYALNAINELTNSYRGKVRFGLSTFPRGEVCGPGTVDIPVDDNNEDSINTKLQGMPKPFSGNTPTGATLQRIAQATAEFGLPSADDTEWRNNYVLLVTDGEANCAGSGAEALALVNSAMDSLLVRVPSVKTFVVGFATPSLAAPLNCNALHGGTSLCPEQTAETCYTNAKQCYYAAESSSALTNALKSIVGQAVNCEFRMDSVPPDLNRVYTYLELQDGDQPTRNFVTRDITHRDGWDFDAKSRTFVFYGSSCTDLKSGQFKPWIIYGCPDVDG